MGREKRRIWVSEWRNRGCPLFDRDNAPARRPALVEMRRQTGMEATQTPVCPFVYRCAVCRSGTGAARQKMAPSLKNERKIRCDAEAATL
ncbi:hypothetical protein XFLAVUS301_36680 [Xanthobacter flavus]|uniref:Uncharacterized protein n=1 Tax=Xanthobacter flavus TaxID=281 RepID=A0A9W6CRF1_XANFL|nr:hypothetical protein XFLAVUS301_36680 [Xanthobacter flavus]